MTRTERLLSFTAALLVAGGVTWLAKLAVLAATDGDESLTVAALYFAGIALLILGSPAVGLALTRSRPRAVRVAAGVLSPLVVVASFAVLDGSVKPLLEDSGPSWIQEEWGILATALLWLAVGTALRGPASGPRPATR